MTEAPKWVLRTHTERLPPNNQALYARLRSILELGRLMKLQVTPDGLTVERMMPADSEDPVIAPAPVEGDVDASFVFSRVELENLPYNEEDPPLCVLLDGCELIRKKRAQPTHVVVPDGPEFAAWLGYEEFTSKHLLGMAVVRDRKLNEGGKIVLLGSPHPTQYLYDVTCGVVVDTGL